MNCAVVLLVLSAGIAIALAIPMEKRQTPGVDILSKVLSPEDESNNTNYKATQQGTASVVNANVADLNLFSDTKDSKQVGGAGANIINPNDVTDPTSGDPTTRDIGDRK